MLKNMNSEQQLHKHPYIEYENTPMWNLIDKTISELEENHDIKLSTAKEYVIGYICKQIESSEEI